MAKTVTLVSLLIVFALKLFFPFVFFFSFAMQKSGDMQNSDMQATDFNFEFRINLQFTEKTISWAIPGNAYFFSMLINI